MSKTPSMFSAPDGRVLAANPQRLFELPFQLLTNPPRNAIAVAGNLGSPQVIMSISGDGPIEIYSWAIDRTSAGRVFLQIQDGQGMRSLMNRSCHVDTMMGTGQRPYLLPETLLIDETRAITATFTNLVGTANSFRALANGVRYLKPQLDLGLEKIRKRMADRQYLSLPYWYTLDQSDVNSAGAALASAGGVTLLAGATGQFSMTIANDSHFDLMQLSAISTSPLWDINIVDATTGESIINAPQDVNFPISSQLVVGTNLFPFRFQEPFFCVAGTKLIVTLVDRSGAPNVIQLTAGGRILAKRMWQ